MRLKLHQFVQEQLKFCSIGFHARFSKGAQNELFVLSSLTTFPRYSLLLVGNKQSLHFYRRRRRGFHPSCHSRDFILHLDLLSKHSEGRACSCSLGLPPSISHIRLSNGLSVFNTLASLSCHLQIQIKLSGGQQIYNYLILTARVMSSTYRLFRLVRLEKIAFGS